CSYSHPSGRCRPENLRSQPDANPPVQLSQDPAPPSERQRGDLPSRSTHELCRMVASLRLQGGGQRVVLGASSETLDGQEQTLEPNGAAARAPRADGGDRPNRLDDGARPDGHCVRQSSTNTTSTRTSPSGPTPADSPSPAAPSRSARG